MAFGDADASTPAFVKASVSSKDATTASFTPPAGALLVAFAFHDTAGGNLTNTSQVTDSQGLTWTRQVTHSKQDDTSAANNGHVAISTAVVASSTSMTVTTTGTNTNNPAGLYVRVITGADTTTPMDATPTEGHNTNAVISQAITTVTDGARVFLIACDWNLAANMTAGTSQTAVVADGIGAPDMRVYVGVQDAVTTPAGAVTMSTATPTTGNTNNYGVVAIRPAAGGSPVTVNAGNAAVAVAGNAATLSTSPAAGNAAVAAAANAAVLSAGYAAGNAAVGAAAPDATLAASYPASHGAVAVAGHAAALSLSPAAGGAAVGAAAGGAVLTSAYAAGFGAVTVGASDATLSIAGATPLPIGFGAVAVGAFDVTLLGGDSGGGGQVSTTGGWYGLLSVLDEIRTVLAEERAAPLVACPNDGEPLQTAQGVLHCRFCGRTYSGNEQL